MNALETTAMLDKITESGGSFYIKDGELFGRDVPMRFHGFVKAEKATIIRLIEAKRQAQKPVAKKRAAVRFELLDNEGGGTILGEESHTIQILVETLIEKWPGELAWASCDGVRVYP